MKAKKILSILLVFVLCFSVFAGCKSGRDKNSNTTPQGGSGGQEELENPSIRTSHIQSGKVGWQVCWHLLKNRQRNRKTLSEWGDNKNGEPDDCEFDGVNTIYHKGNSDKKRVI